MFDGLVSAAVVVLAVLLTVWQEKRDARARHLYMTRNTGGWWR